MSTEHFLQSHTLPKHSANRLSLPHASQVWISHIHSPLCQVGQRTVRSLHQFVDRLFDLPNKTLHESRAAIAQQQVLPIVDVDVVGRFEVVVVHDVVAGVGTVVDAPVGVVFTRADRQLVGTCGHVDADLPHALRLRVLEDMWILVEQDEFRAADLEEHTVGDGQDIGTFKVLVLEDIAAVGSVPGARVARSARGHEHVLAPGRVLPTR